MKVLLALLILNHTVFICFELYLESMMMSTDSRVYGQAPGYGMLYALVIFPGQVLLEALLVIGLVYQMFFVKHMKAYSILWIAAAGSFLMVIRNNL
ncbi:hypothetical protein [Vibrio algivorus]|uniref:Uncharacterized protein n=1 Tax=Vibrio algivorus TaxID=1667024 RepID=A0A557P035_9VIBR|nr:hypothetical protein [Vibrio algivorus]TVO34022.1 hypothetical protein FOF44_14230 [Vibrio algivorus]GLT13773.1 hypothetical protein GCM10007931_07470 [Vibrio algivorus]